MVGSFPWLPVPTGGHFLFFGVAALSPQCRDVAVFHNPERGEILADGIGKVGRRQMADRHENRSTLPARGGHIGAFVSLAFETRVFSTMRSRFSMSLSVHEA